MVTPEQVQSYIERGLECLEVRVAGDGQHFEALIVSEAFRGRSRISASPARLRRPGGTHARGNPRAVDAHPDA